MKCAVAFSVLLAGSSIAFADSPNPRSSARQPAPAPLLNELVRLTRAGESELTVLAYARAHRAELPSEVSVATLRWLRDAGVGERVVAYMAAIDVRVPDAPGWNRYRDDRGNDERDGRPRRAEAQEPEDDFDRGDDSRRYTAGRDSSSYGDSYADSDLIAESDSGFRYGGWGYGYDPYFGFDPYFGYPYAFSSFPSAFFFDRGGFFRRFPRRNRDDHRNHHRFDGGGHHGTMSDRVASREAWRDRGPRDPRKAGRALGPRRGPGGPAFARGVPAQGYRGRAVGARGFAPKGASRGMSSPAFRGSRAGAGMSGFRGAGPSGGAHFRSSGGSRGGAPANSGGRGRR